MLFRCDRQQDTMPQVRALAGVLLVTAILSPGGDAYAARRRSIGTYPGELAANGDRYSCAQGAVLTVDAARGVLGNDSAPDRTRLIAIQLSAPTHGFLTFHPDGSFTYTNDGSSATSDSFNYKASNGDETTLPASVTITITTPPSITASADAYSLAHGATLNVPPPGLQPSSAPLRESARQRHRR